MSLKYSNISRFGKTGRGLQKGKSEGAVIGDFKLAANKRAIVKLFRGKVYLDIRKYEKGRPTRSGITLNEFEIDKFVALLGKIIKAVDGAIKLKTDTDPPAEIFMFEGEEGNTDDDTDDNDNDNESSILIDAPSGSKRKNVHVSGRETNSLDI
jgi:hypothetical protein